MENFPSSVHQAPCLDKYRFLSAAEESILVDLALSCDLPTTGTICWRRLCVCPIAPRVEVPPGYDWLPPVQEV